MELIEIKTNSKPIKPIKKTIIKYAIKIMKEQGKVNIKKLANELDITYSSCYRIIRQWNEYVNTEINNKMYK